MPSVDNESISNIDIEGICEDLILLPTEIVVNDVIPLTTKK